MPKKGLPIGNLTSQLFANIYLNTFDQFVKHELKVRYYARYTDDFVIVDSDKEYLLGILNPIKQFLKENLDLNLHPGKVFLKKSRQGVDFLGYITLPHYRIIRTKTKKRIFKKLKARVFEYKMGKIDKKSLDRSLQSYLGVLSHANTYRLKEELLNQFWFWLNE